MVEVQLNLLNILNIFHSKNLCHNKKIIKPMYMYLGFIVPIYSFKTGRLFNISVRDKLIPGTQFPMNHLHTCSCIQEYKHLN